MDKLVGTVDALLVPGLLIMFWIAGYFYANSKYANSVLKKYFLTGLMYKAIAGIIAGSIFIYYYQKGDTIYYFGRGKYLAYVFWDDPFSNWVIYFPEFFREEILSIPSFPEFFLDKANSYMVIRFVAILSSFLFSSYFGITLFFALFSFIGSWKLFKVFYYQYPQLHKEIALFTLYLPSLLLWGSGLFKDTITFGALGMLIYCIHSMFVRFQFKPKYFIIAGITFYLIGVIKPYILMALLPSLVFYLMNEYSSRIGSGFVRTILFPFILVLIVAISVVLLNSLNTTFTTYNLDNMNDKMEGFQRWHGIRTEQTEGTGYSLGPSVGGVLGLIQKFPLAVNVTLFRPYLGESLKPLVVLASLESLFFLYLTITTIFKVGIGKFFGLIFKDPFISFCFIFSIIFAFSVGLTSYNFGALVRYKIPCLPFYLAVLYIVRYRITGKYSSLI